MFSYQAPHIEDPGHGISPGRWEIENKLMPAQEE
jgi:hypothetical protein